MKLGGIFLEKEAVNFLLDKVGDPYITRYDNHISSAANSRSSQHASMPDLYPRNFPAGRQRVDDSRTHRTTEALFEVKTHRACNSCYNKNNRITKTLITELKKS